MRRTQSPCFRRSPLETDPDPDLDPDQPQESLQPPVQKGDVRVVEIEAIGQEGDGIATVERGYVVIVPEIEVGDEVTIEITNVTENFAVGEVTAGRSDSDH